MKKIAIVANRSSGRESATTYAFRARAKLWGWPCEFYFPDSIEEFRATCSTIHAKQYEALITIGGDGTVNQLIQSHPNLQALPPLYPFPGGTANDLAQELGLTPDWDQVQSLLEKKQFDWIDLLQVNGKRFSTVGGIGVGAIFTREFNQKRNQSALYKKLAQFFHYQFYTFLSAKTILLKRNYIHRLHIRSSEFEARVKTPAVFFCNQAYMGGNVKVAPCIDNSDKRFNVLIIKRNSKSGLLRAMMQSKLGKLPSQSVVFSTECLEIEDLDGRPLAVFGDGEPLGENSRLEIKIFPKSLRVYRELKGVK